MKLHGLNNSGLRKFRFGKNGVDAELPKLNRYIEQIYPSLLLLRWTGVDLSDLAVEYSFSPSKEEGGMLGWVKTGQMVPEFEEAASNAPLNKVVRCKTKFGWHLLQFLSEREEAVLEYIQPSELHEKMLYPTFLEGAQLVDVREPHEVHMHILASGYI